jgi:glycosyltransferase involved in cell wall biosynthesis
MRICHVITRLIVGGAQENTILTCRGLSERGHEVTLVAGPETGPEGSLWDETTDAPFGTVTVTSLCRSVRPISDLNALRELRRLFERLRPEIVHTHSSKAGILAREAALRAGVPIIIHTIHGMSFNRTQGRFTQAFYRFLERRAAKNTTAFVTVADAMIEQCVDSGIASRDRFTTIRSGMETGNYRPDGSERSRRRREWGVGADEVVVGTIARLFDNKGYEEILAALPRAAARCSKLRFVWIGDGANRKKYEAELDRLGLRDRVHLVGLVPPASVPSYINGFDLLVHASRWEGLPRAVVQAQLMEVPAVSFDNDGAPEVVLPGETGVLVRFGDISGLVEAMVRLASDADLRARLGRTGRERCLKAFDWRVMVDQIEALYERLMKERP